MLNILERIDRNRQASAEVERRFNAWLSSIRQTTEEGRNNARRRIALEVQQEYM